MVQAAIRAAVEDIEFRLSRRLDQDPTSPTGSAASAPDGDGIELVGHQVDAPSTLRWTMCVAMGLSVQGWRTKSRTCPVQRRSGRRWRTLSAVCRRGWRATAPGRARPPRRTRRQPSVSRYDGTLGSLAAPSNADTLPMLLPRPLPLPLPLPLLLLLLLLATCRKSTARTCRGGSCRVVRVVGPCQVEDVERRLSARFARHQISMQQQSTEARREAAEASGRISAEFLEVGAQGSSTSTKGRLSGSKTVPLCSGGRPPRRRPPRVAGGPARDAVRARRPTDGTADYRAWPGRPPWPWPCRAGRCQRA